MGDQQVEMLEIIKKTRNKQIAESTQGILDQAPDGAEIVDGLIGKLESMNTSIIEGGAKIGENISSGIGRFFSNNQRPQQSTGQIAGQAAGQGIMSAATMNNPLLQALTAGKTPGQAIGQGIGTIQQAPELIKKGVRGVAKGLGDVGAKAIGGDFGAEVAVENAIAQGLLDPSQREGYIKDYKKGFADRKASEAKSKDKDKKDPAISTEFAEKKEKAEQNKNIWGELVKRLGVPVASAIAAAINPDLLPGAAGLSIGYAEGFKGAEEATATAEAKKQEQAVELAKAQISAAPKIDAVDIEKLTKAAKESGGVFGKIDAREKAEIEFIRQKYIEQFQSTTNPGKISVKHPEDGREVDILPEHLKQAIKEGFELKK